jgi:hypothetical protein
VGQLEDAELKAAIKDGIVTPALKRSDLEGWLQTKKYRQKRIRPQRLSLPDVFYAAIRLMDAPSPEQIEQLDEMLDQIRLRVNAEIIRPRDRYGEAMNRWAARVAKRIRQQAQRIVWETEKRALSKIPKKALRKMSKQDRMKVWGFHWDETLIDADADDERVREVLDLIGRGDEFDKLRDRVYSEVEQPTAPAKAESAAKIEEDFGEVAAQIRNRRRRKTPNLGFLDFQ